jgi:uncharacterized membrane protein
MKDMIKIFYTGNGAVNCTFGINGGTVYSRLHSIVERKQLHKALLSDKEFKVTRIPPFLTPAKFPSIDELMEYDVLVISDVDYESLIKYPNNARGPDRARAIKRFVEKGGGYLHAGGSFGYHGEAGRAKYWRTPIADLLPLDFAIIPSSIIFERKEGFKIKALKPNHEIMRGIPWEKCPYRLKAYEYVGQPKKEANVLATVGKPGEEKDPCLVEWTYGKGRVIAFT